MSPPSLAVGLVVEGTDRFVQPIETALHLRHRVRRFSPYFVRLPVVGRSLNDRLLVRQLRRFLRHSDVVFFEWAGPLAAMASHQRPLGKRVVRAHRTEVFTQLDEFDWSSVDKVVFVSQAMRSRFVNKFPEAAGQALTVYNGVDLQRFVCRLKPFSWRIGMLGNLTPRKRVYDVICALSDLHHEIPWRLFVGGPPVDKHLDYWDALQTLVDQLDVSHKIEFSGYVSDPTAWLQSLDVYLSASYSEGHQVALLEAMASGCYCLSHCWDGADEVLPQEHIFTTDSDLRQKLLDYAARPEGHKRAAQARMRAIAEERFDERRMVREIVEIVESVGGS